jgi:uncharacterized protein (DUF58 family)
LGRALLIALLGGLLVGAGVALGPLPLLVPGVALVLLAAGAGGWVLLAGRGRVERRLGLGRAVEEEPLAVVLEARTVLPTPGSELVEPLAPPAGATRGEPVGGGRHHRLATEVRFGRRGRHVLEPAQLVVRDPLRIAAHTLRSPAGQDVLVLPRIERVRVSARSGARAGTLARASAQPAEDGPRIELDTLREAPPGAPAARIHWPAVARTGVLIERTLLPETDRRPLVVLDAAYPSSAEALDKGVRAAASLCVALARAGGCDLLLPGERRPAHVDAVLAAWPTLHARLALVAEGPAPILPGRFARAGAVFWVTGREPGRATAYVPPALARASGAGRFLVEPGPARAGSVFTVAGCAGRRLDRGDRRAEHVRGRVAA